MKTLVTGGGGFLGQAIVRQLLHRGDQVTVLGRNPYPQLEKLGVTTVQGDIRDEETVNRVCQDVEVVFHTAAIAGLWGRWEHFHSINTVGTRVVVDACVRNNVQKLIYTSSPSVVFFGTDQAGINEDTPYPIHHLCYYTQTKAMAERHVLDSHDRTKLLTCALRPHLIWGPGDQHLIPRVIERASLGKLKRVGDGTNKVDQIYVDNAAAAHLQASDALTEGSAVGGKAYFVSEGEPVNLWMWINEILMLAGQPRVKRSVSFRNAFRAGQLLEGTYRTFGWWNREPVMTRFLASQLACDHYYDISRAKRDFGLRSIVSFEEGMDRLGRYLAGETNLAYETLRYDRPAEEVAAARSRSNSSSLFDSGEDDEDVDEFDDDSSDSSSDYSEDFS